MPASLTYYVAETLSEHQQQQNALIKEVVTYLRSKLLWMENDFESSVQVPSEFFKPLRHILRKSLRFFGPKPLFHVVCFMASLLIHLSLYNLFPSSQLFSLTPYFEFSLEPRVTGLYSFII